MRGRGEFQNESQKENNMSGQYGQPVTYYVGAYKVRRHEDKWYVYARKAEELPENAISEHEGDFGAFAAAERYEKADQRRG